jgi:hypothetical protein
MKKQNRKNKISEPQKSKIPAKYKYFSTLWESFLLVVKNPVILIPFLAATILSFLSLPLAAKFQSPEYLLQNIPLLIFYALLSLFAGIVVYGWTFSMVKQLLAGSVNLRSSFKKAFSFGFRSLGIALLAVLVLCLIYILVISAIAVFSYLPAVLAGVISLAVLAILLVFLILYASAFLQTIPVLIIEDKGVIETIKATISFYFKKKLFSLNILLVTILVYFILMIPYGIYYSILFQAAVLYEQGTYAMYTTNQLFVMQLLAIIPNLFYLVFFVYYSKSYLTKKATIKEK